MIGDISAEETEVRGCAALRQCFNVKLEQPLSGEQAATLTWLLRETYEPHLLTPASQLPADGSTDAVVEVHQGLCCFHHDPRTCGHARHGEHPTQGLCMRWLLCIAAAIA